MVQVQCAGLRVWFSVDISLYEVIVAEWEIMAGGVLLLFSVLIIMRLLNFSIVVYVNCVCNLH